MRADITSLDDNYWMESSLVDEYEVRLLQSSLRNALIRITKLERVAEAADAYTDSERAEDWEELCEALRSLEEGREGR